MGDAAVATLLEHLEKAEDVGGHVGVRPLQGVTHAGLGSEVNDALEVASVEELIHGLRVRERRAHELEVAVLLQDRETRLLESDVVVLIHRIETYYLVAVGQEAEGDVEPDESCCTCHEYLHRLFSVEGRPGPTEPSLPGGHAPRAARVGARGIIRARDCRASPIGRWRRKFYLTLLVTPPSPPRIRVLRAIARLNVGGPAWNAVLLTAGTRSRYPTVLAVGATGPHEADMSGLAEEIGRAHV